MEKLLKRLEKEKPALEGGSFLFYDLSLCSLGLVYNVLLLLSVLFPPASDTL
jgi:hypothetical protein